MHEPFDKAQLVIGYQLPDKKPPDKKKNQTVFKLLRRPPLVLLATGGGRGLNKYPHMLMVLGLIENRLNKTRLKK